MSEHPDSSKCPVFSYRNIGRYSDCLSQQVAEALRIMYTTDQILKSKNEYMANCLTRLCFEEDRYERKKRERKEEEEEQQEIKELEAFKARD
jgi:LytS/YehU family sensor histidine kinase